jgi:hypothetical protein
VETADQYLVQTAKVISAELLQELIDLRTRIGFSLAYLGDEMVLRAIQIVRSRPGASSRIREAARSEKTSVKLTAAKASASASGSSSNQAQVLALMGPRGGLPRAKGDLEKLAGLLSVPVRGMTIDQMKHVIRSKMSSSGTPMSTAPSPVPSTKASSRASGTIVPSSVQPVPPSTDPDDLAAIVENAVRQAMTQQTTMTAEVLRRETEAILQHRPGNRRSAEKFYMGDEMAVDHERAENPSSSGTWTLEGQP